jgi:hypothetical protein
MKKKVNDQTIDCKNASNNKDVYKQIDNKSLSQNIYNFCNNGLIE